MSEDKTNNPDYPIYAIGNMGRYRASFGMSLLQHYAGLMMQAQIIQHSAETIHSWDEAKAAKNAVSAAHALIRELAKQGGDV